ncbi:DUF4158 domain-containing protein, partial [Klebsiella quasipneumoniae]
MGSCAAPSAKGDDKFITTDYLQQCHHNRLGIALQIGCVRFLGTFLTDMNHIPSGVRHFTARQLEIRDITVLAEYGQRENTRREHAALIRQH